MAGIDEIDTIVVVMMENRSFDHVLGHLHHPEYGNRPEIDGLNDPDSTPDYNNFYQNQAYKPFAIRDHALPHDLPHTRSSIETQLNVVNGQATMGGFVHAYVEATGSVVSQPPPMAFLEPSAVPTTDFLAREHLVCNRWFASLPTGTQPNRAVAFTGESLIDDNVTGFIPYGQSVFDWLTEHDVRWRVYHSGLSFFLLFDLFNYFSDHFRSIRELPRDFAEERASRRPQVIFIEPEYEDSPVHIGGMLPNDNHPPLPMGPGEVFLHNIYSTLASNPKRWARTLLVVNYDEHGGFYDHCPPPPMNIPLPADAEYTQAFTRLGPRLPALLASPMVERGGVSNQLFDHTSVLQLLAEKFAGGPRNYSNAVTARRDQGIESLSAAITRSKPRQDLPLAPEAPITQPMYHRGGVKKPLSDNQQAFKFAAREHLDKDARQAKKAFPELTLLKAEDGL